MRTHVFTLILDRAPSDEDLDRLFEARFDDAIFGVEGGLVTAQFDRAAPTLADAIVEAVRGLDSLGFVAVRVQDDDLLTLADIASRVGQSRESIRRYAVGARGPGGFPSPVNPDRRDGTTFYRWSEVAPWLRTKLHVEIEETDPALVMANLVLQARLLRGRVEHMSALDDLFVAQP